MAVWGRARNLSATEAPRNIKYLQVSRREKNSSVKLQCQSGARIRDYRLSKQAALTSAPGPPPLD